MDGAAAPAPAGRIHAQRWASNERIAASARAHRFGATTAVPFICECSDDRCSELIRLPLGEFSTARTLGRYLVVPGHAVDEAHRLHTERAYWIVGEDI